MLTRIKHRAAMIAACILGIYLSPSFAEDAPAYGLFKASLGCDKTPEGMKVTLLDRESRARMRDNLGIDIELGDPCLASLALLPSSFLAFATYANFAPGGASTQIGECLVWAIDDGTVYDTTSPGFGDRRKALLVCDADGAGGLKTVLVAGNGYTPQEGESCGVTRAALTTEGTRTSGPFAAKFKYDGGEPNGGLMFLGRGPGTVEVLECNVNEAGDDVVVPYLETQDGVNTTALGEPCTEVLAVREAMNGLQFGAPTAIPAGYTNSPGVLIFDISDPANPKVE